MDRLTLTRRGLLATAAATALPIAARAEERCVVGTWGGDYARLLRRTSTIPILKPAGITVIQESATKRRASPKWCAQKMLPHGTLDIACLGALNGYRAGRSRPGRATRATKVPNLKHVLPNAASDCFVPHIYSAQVLVYNRIR